MRFMRLKVDVFLNRKPRRGRSLHMTNRVQGRVLWAAFLCAAFFGSPNVARAGITADPVGDFLATYPGPHNGDLDVVGAEGTFDGTKFVMHAILNGDVGTTVGAIYVLGFNRGAGTAGFGASLGLNGVLFDRVVVVTNIDTSSNTPGVTVTHSGHDLFASIPLSALPSTGFAPKDYTWNLWPRNPLLSLPPGTPGVAVITDFAPDNSNVRVASVPEPSTLALVLLGVPLAGIAHVRRRRRAAA